MIEDQIVDEFAKDKSNSSHGAQDPMANDHLTSESRIMTLMHSIQTRRQRLDQQLTDLQEKLDPSSLVQESSAFVLAKRDEWTQLAIRRSNIMLEKLKTDGRSLIKSHPFAVATIGAGITWIVAQRIARRTSEQPCAKTQRTASNSGNPRRNQFAHRSKEYTQLGVAKVRNAKDEYPLSIGMASLLCGIAAGWSIPMSRQEYHWAEEAQSGVLEKYRSSEAANSGEQPEAAEESSTAPASVRGDATDTHVASPV